MQEPAFIFNLGIASVVPSKTDWHNAKEPQTKTLPAGNDVGSWHGLSH
jgi:hypothetical protein